MTAHLYLLGTGTAIFSIVDLLSLDFCRAYFLPFFSIIRCDDSQPALYLVFSGGGVGCRLLVSPKKTPPVYAASLVLHLATLLAVLCTPSRQKAYCWLSAPVLFIDRLTIGVGKISHPLLNFS